MPADSALEQEADPAPERSKQILWICLQSFLLLLVVRWCARTYPGLYFPDSAFLNDQLNGNGLFTRYGYDAVLVGAAARAARIWVAGRGRRGADLALTFVQWASLVILALIVLWGVYWAEGVGRLPWQQDGWGPFLGTLGFD